MTIFEVLFVSHLIGDWLLQTEWQAQNKASNWSAMLAHVVVYHVVMAAVLILMFDFAWTVFAAVIVGLGIAHIILDRRTFVAWLIRTLRISVNRTPETWLPVAVDQSLHFLLLGAAAVILTTYAL